MLKSTANKIILVGAVFVAVVCALIFGYVFIYPFVGNYLYRTTFDPVVWSDSAKAHQYSDWPPRLRMVDDLLARNELLGKKLDEVIRFLGKPDDINGFEGHNLIYWLGPERGFIRLDSEWLVLDVGKDSVITKVTVQRD